jgi:hypothetical protein
MLVMGSNSWKMEMPKKALIVMSLKWSEEVKSKGVAELRGAWVDMDKKLLWCYWETDNLEALQVEFDEMNKRFGLESELSVVEQYFPK